MMLTEKSVTQTNRIMTGTHTKYWPALGGPAVQKNAAGASCIIRRVGSFVSSERIRARRMSCRSSGKPQMTQ